MTPKGNRNINGKDEDEIDIRILYADSVDDEKTYPLAHIHFITNSCK